MRAFQRILALWTQQKSKICLLFNNILTDNFRIYLFRLKEIYIPLVISHQNALHYQTPVTQFRLVSASSSSSTSTTSQALCFSKDMGNFPEYIEEDFGNCCEEVISLSLEEKKCMLCCQTNAANAKFCSFCSGALDLDKCECGADLQSFYRFCNQCSASNPNFSNLKRSANDINQQ